MISILIYHAVMAGKPPSLPRPSSPTPWAPKTSLSHILSSFPHASGKEGPSPVLASPSHSPPPTPRRPKLIAPSVLSKSSLSLSWLDYQHLNMNKQLHHLKTPPPASTLSPHPIQPDIWQSSPHPTSHLLLPLAPLGFSLLTAQN